MRFLPFSMPSWLGGRPAVPPLPPRPAPSEKAMPARPAPALPPRAPAGLAPAGRSAPTVSITTPAARFAARQPLTESLVKLQAMRDRARRPAAEPAVLASVDLAGSLATRHVQLPPMTVSVTCDDPRLIGPEGSAQESIVLQRLQVAAFEAIRAASREVQDALRAYDASLADRPPASPQEARERQRTFETVCRQIATAQQGRVDQAVQQAWAVQKQRDVALQASRARFGVKLTMQSVSVAANAATTALLPNPLSPAKAAYSLFRMGQTIQQFAKDREQAARSIEKGDAALAALQDQEAGGGAGAHAWRTRTRETASAVHIPFTQKLFRSVHHQEEKLDEFLAKSARVDRQASAMYAEAQALLDTLAQQPSPFPGAPDPHADMRREVTDLMTSLGDLMASIDRDNRFYAHHKARCRAFHAHQPAGLREQADNVDHAATAVRVGRFAGNLAKIATHLGA